MVTAKPWDAQDEQVRQILCELRDEKLETVRSLEAKTGISRGRIHTLLTGDRSPATLGEISRLALAFGVSLTAVVHEAERRVVAASLLTDSAVADLRRRPAPIEDGLTATA
ncbi:MAG: helix-turn-helix domain-containing protein [Cellulomonadaceae bacterium]|nr:helix-turn-helix domain-containing protein [Cellulomonadaceae bacterium]